MWIQLDDETAQEIASQLGELLRIYADTGQFSERVRVRRNLSKLKQGILDGASKGN